MFSRIRNTNGRYRPPTGRRAKSRLPAGTCGEHGITILAGRAVEGAQVLVEGEGDVGVLRTGQAVHEVREQGAGAGKKYVKRLHRRCFSMLAAHDRGSDWLSIS